MTFLLALSAPERGEAAEWLSRLESDSASVRGEAQRWLAAHLERDDFGVLHRAALEGGPEANRRIVSALASSERHFGLAVLLGIDERPKVSELGREALLELASAWNVETEKQGLRRSSVLTELAIRSRSPFILDPRARGIAATIELLNNASESGVTLVLDPDLMTARSTPEVDSRTEGRLIGDEAELLSDLARSYSVGLDGFGLDGSGDMAWIRICRRLREGKSTGRELLVEWSLRVARGEDAAEAKHCARALAGSGWPAAILWLEERWFERSDEAALSALRLLGSRGLVSPSMRSIGVQQVLLERKRWENALGETARALGALGTHTGLGEELESGLLEDWDLRDARASWLRLVVLELRRAGTMESRARVLAVLTDSSSSPALFYQALRTAVALDMTLVGPLAQGFPAARLEAVFRYANTIDDGRELVQMLVRLGVPPESNLATTDKLALCEWAFLAGRSDLARSFLIALAEAPAAREHPANCALVERLRDWQRAGYGEQLARLLQAASFERIRLHLGLLESEACERLLELGLAENRATEIGGVELQGLAALAAGPKGTRVLELLLGVARARSAGPDDSALGEALSEAVRVLREARHDVQLEPFVAQLRRLGWPESWPPPPRPAPLALRLFERRYES